MLGNAELLRDQVGPGETREMADEIVTAAQRAAALTRQMLAYAGQRDFGQREPVDLGALLVELRTLLAATLSKKAHLETRRRARQRRCRAIARRSSQVLMNLLTNASDALGDRTGVVEVRARR